MALELNGSTGVSLVQDGVVTAADLASTLDLTGKTVTLPAGVGGKVLQVVSAAFTGTQAINIASAGTTNWVDVSSLSVAVTPSSTANKLLITAHVHCSTQVDDAGCAFRFDANGSTIGIGNADGNKARFSFGVNYVGTTTFSIYAVTSVSMTFLYSPNSTLAQTIKVQGSALDAQSTSNGLYINRSRIDQNPTLADGNGAWTGRAISTLTVMEIAG